MILHAWTLVSSVEPPHSTHFSSLTCQLVVTLRTHSFRVICENIRWMRRQKDADLLFCRAETGWWRFDCSLDFFWTRGPSDPKTTFSTKWTSTIYHLHLLNEYGVVETSVSIAQKTKVASFSGPASMSRSSHFSCTSYFGDPTAKYATQNGTISNNTTISDRIMRITVSVSSF